MEERMKFIEKLEEYNKLKQRVAYNESTIAKCKLMVTYLQRCIIVTGKQIGRAHV